MVSNVCAWDGGNIIPDSLLGSSPKQVKTYMKLLDAELHKKKDTKNGVKWEFRGGRYLKHKTHNWKFCFRNKKLHEVEVILLSYNNDDFLDKYSKILDRLTDRYGYDEKSHITSIDPDKNLFKQFRGGEYQITNWSLEGKKIGFICLNIGDNIEDDTDKSGVQFIISKQKGE